MNLIRKTLLSSKFWLMYWIFWSFFWVVTFPFAMITWKESVIYLIFISQVTALTGSLGGLAGTLAERKADPNLATCDPESEIKVDADTAIVLH